MRPILLFTFAVFIVPNLWAQIKFENILPVQNEDFLSCVKSKLLFFDFDNDGDEDLAMFGGYVLNQPFASLYINNGEGIFTKHEESIFYAAPLNGGIGALDLDNDNDLDLFVTGNNGGLGISTLYTNNYNELFSGCSTEILSLLGLYSGDLEVFDANDDGFDDVLMTGFGGMSSSDIHSTIFLNNTQGDLVFHASVTGLYYSSADVGDIDNDGDIDLIISGQNFNSTLTTIYINDGDANFTLLPTNVVNLSNGSTEFRDLDNDNDLDIILTGKDASGTLFIKTYKNNGAASFVEFSNFNLIPLEFSDMDFSDVDSDGDIDFVISGHDGTSARTILYLNSGNGEFFISNQPQFIQLYLGSVDFSDIDLDGDDDLLITGMDGQNIVWSELYENNGLGEFTWIKGIPFTKNLEYSSIKVIDVDNDLDLDIAIEGFEYDFPEHSSFVYLNDGTGQFEPDTVNTFQPMQNVYMDYADIDNDLDLDMIIMGDYFAAGALTDVYKNDGSGIFTLNSSLPQPLYFGRFDFSDIDFDGDLDFIINGLDSLVVPTTALYINDGSGLFSLDTSANFMDYYAGVIEFADVDGDLDEDFLISGYTSNADATSLYLNNGSGVFTLDQNQIFPSDKINFHFGDMDGDGDADLIANNFTTLFYLENNGSGQFSTTTLWIGNQKLIRTFALADIDNDGDLDISYVFKDQLENYEKFKALLNDGAGTFEEINFPNNVKPLGRAILFADLDGDSDLDLFLDGQNFQTEVFEYGLYRNVPCTDAWDTMTVFGCESYTLPSGKVISSTGIYLDTLQSGINCSTYYQVDATIYNVNVGVSVSSGTLAAVTTNTNATFHWLDCASNLLIPGATGSSYTPNVSGSYAVKVTENGCSKFSTCYTILPVSTEELSTLNLQLVPNPARNEMKISGLRQFAESEYSYQIINLQGISVKQGIVSGDNEKIEISFISSGSYFLQLNLPTGLFTIPFIKI